MTTTTMTAEAPSKGLHYGLWAVQALASVAWGRGVKAPIAARA